jgi:hypothetical protein
VLPLLVVIATSAAPVACAGVRAVSVTASTTVTDVAAAPPNITFAGTAVENPPPRIVTSVPPARGPDDGDTDPTDGAGTVQV